MKQLRDRVLKLRDDSDHIYHLSRTEGTPTINWGNMMDEKLVGSVSVSHVVPLAHRSEVSDAGGYLLQYVEKE